MAYPSVKTNTKEDIALDALANILAGSQGSPFYKAFIETKKAVSSARNLYVDLVADSVEYASSLEKRQWQEKYFDILNKSYQNNQIKQYYSIIYYREQWHFIHN